MKLSEALDLFNLHNNPSKLKGYEKALTFTNVSGDFLVVTVTMQDDGQYVDWIRTYSNITLETLAEHLHIPAKKIAIGLTDWYEENFLDTLDQFDVQSVTIGKMRTMLIEFNPTHQFLDTNSELYTSDDEPVYNFIACRLHSK